MTLKAARLIAACPVTASIAGEDGPSMARTIAGAHIPAGRIEVVMRMAFTRDRGSANAAYDQGADAIAAHLSAGRDVAMLCEGDPTLFGSFLYMLDRLGGRFPVEIVPGITSVSAAAAAALWPLTTGGDGLTVLPAARPDADIRRALQGSGTVALLKVGRHLARIKALLAAEGCLASARYAERVGHADQRLAPLTAVDEAPYFSLILARPPRSAEESAPHAV